MIILGDSWPTEKQEAIGVINSQEELEALYRSARVRHLPSDDERYDEGFPDPITSSKEAEHCSCFCQAR
jgi:hypothetical protein